MKTFIALITIAILTTGCFSDTESKSSHAEYFTGNLAYAKNLKGPEVTLESSPCVKGSWIAANALLTSVIAKAATIEAAENDSKYLTQAIKNQTLTWAGSEGTKAKSGTWSCSTSMIVDSSTGRFIEFDFKVLITHVDGYEQISSDSEEDIILFTDDQLRREMLKVKHSVEVKQEVKPTADKTPVTHYFSTACKTGTSFDFQAVTHPKLGLDFSSDAKGFDGRLAEGFIYVELVGRDISLNLPADDIYFPHAGEHNSKNLLKKGHVFDEEECKTTYKGYKS